METEGEKEKHGRGEGGGEEKGLKQTRKVEEREKRCVGMGWS